MRIALVTPLNGRSAIGAWAAFVGPALAARGHAVTIVRSEGDDPRLDAPLRLPPLPVAPGIAVVEGRGLTAPALRRLADAVVYAVGNHYGHHAEVPRLLAGVPGVVVLHDSDLQQLDHGWHAVSPDDAPAASGVVWFAARATGAVVHAEFYAGATRSACRGPVAVLPLAFPGLDVPAPRLREPGSPLVLATVGDANPNKRHEQVIDAIAMDPALRAGVTYRVLGSAQPERQAALAARAAAAGVQIDFSGWLDPAALAAALAETDALCCLRDPVTEGASASVLVGLLAGRPGIVGDAGSFAELPEGGVLRVPAGAELPELAHRLLTLLHQPAIGRAVAATGQAWARERSGAGRYADGLLALLDAAREAAPRTGFACWVAAEAEALGLPNDRLVARVLAALPAVRRPG